MYSDSDSGTVIVDRLPFGNFPRAESCGMGGIGTGSWVVACGEELVLMDSFSDTHKEERLYSLVVCIRVGLRCACACGRLLQ